MKGFFLFLFPLILSFQVLAACNRVVLRGREREMEPVTGTFSHPVSDTYRAARESVIRLGYKIQTDDESEGTLKTSWRSTKASSHYVDLFDRRDYGTVGAYYRIEMKISNEDGQSEVEVEAPVRSVVGRIRSAHAVEKEVLKKMADLLRREDFEMTNVGVTD